jgi:hypothetical protein
MFNNPQHIKKYVPTETYKLLENGEKTFELRPSNIDLNKGDLISFVEVAEEGNPESETGRGVTQRVTQIEKADSAAYGKEEVDLYGLTILSLNEPSFSTFASLFDQYFAMGLAIGKTNEGWDPLGPPTYWPMLICPEIAESGILEELKIDNWPNGVYSIHLKVLPIMEEGDGPLKLDLVDGYVLVMTHGEGELHKEVLGKEVDISALILGRITSTFGDKEIKPISVEEVRTYYAEDLEPSDEDMIPVDIEKLAGDFSDESVQNAVVETVKDYGIDEFFENYEDDEPLLEDEPNEP